VQVLVVHGGWLTGTGGPGRLALWAEDPALPLTSSSRARDRPHPFAVSAGALFAALTGATGPASSSGDDPDAAGAAGGPCSVNDVRDAVAKAVEGTVTLHLPGTAKGPLPSPEAGSETAGRGVRLTAWAVPVLLLPADAALAALGALAEPDPDGPWSAAASLRYLCMLGGHACDMARRGRMLPHLVDEDGEPTARWRPVITGADAATYRDFAAAMPPVCRAFTAAAAPPGEPAPGEEDGLRSGERQRRDGRAGWGLEFALQSTEDPSLYLPAAELWEGTRIPGLPQRPDETLLAGLGRAVRLFPLLHVALRDPEPAAMTLDTAEAHEFLRQAAPLLQAAGFGVMLPKWAGRKAVGLKLTTRSRTKKDSSRAVADSGFGLDQLVSFRIDLVIGDGVVTAEELAELARLKVPLIRVRGQWVELDDRQLKAALKAVGRRQEGEVTAGEVLQQVVDGGDEDLPLVDVDADGLLGDLLSGAADRLTPVPTPAAFRGTLRPYQERGLSWLHFLARLGLGGILADDMGLGKTAQTLSLLLAERADGRAPLPTLLICPMSLVSNWQKEAARFAPGLRVYVHHGGTRRRDDEFLAAVAEADLVITTYGTALRDLGALRDIAWERVACDEAQAIKNSGTRQSQAVRAIPARTRLALTGTPVENHLAELWSIMEFCNPGMLGPAKRFRRRFQEPIEIRQDADATAALKRATGPFVLRRLKTDKSIISDLPEKNEMKVWCTLTAEQATLYQAVVEDMMAVIEGSEGIQRRGNVIAAMTKLKQVCNHPAHLLKDGSRLPGRSGKLARLEELTEEIIDDGDKALIFTQYSEFGSMLQPYLAAQLDRPVLWLHGGLSKARRDELVDRFQHDDEPMLFLLSLKAAGTGLNLTAANQVIHFDRWWNPAVEDQATDRAFRIGQARNVQVRKFICAGTLEEKIDAMIERKKALASSVVGTGEDWVADLSTDQLRELLSLDPSSSTVAVS
jgi:SNF2 family DNA or RNA helicase